MQTFLPVDRQCLYGLSNNFEFNFRFICESVFFKKVSNGQKFTGSKFVHKTSPQCNSIDTTPEPSLTRNLKVANKDLRHLIGYETIVLFFLLITNFHSLIIELYFPIFALCLLIGCSLSPISPKVHRDRPLFTFHYGRPYILDLYQMYFLFPPPPSPPPDINPGSILKMHYCSQPIRFNKPNGV